MQKEIELALSPADAAVPERIRELAIESAGVRAEDLTGSLVVKRSIDGRSRSPLVRLKVRLFLGEPVVEHEIPSTTLPNADGAPTVVIVGCGPAGLFAAIKCLQSGLRPLIFERGKPVRERRRDIAVLNKEHIVDPDSNYCFGEGGAGTFSDGKLYTRSTKRGNVQEVLNWMVAFGASTDILVDAQPHIGTNRLPAIIDAMRGSIEAAGGEVRFNTRLTDIEVINGRVAAAVFGDGSRVACDRLILATGHSARDIFELLDRKSILIEAKDLAIGVRVEHPQQVIDKLQYHCEVRDALLPPANYRLSHQVKGIGVYSFCMCPGGIIAPCATEQEEVVTNGWSPSKRNNPFANSGLVVQLRRKTEHPLDNLTYQRMIEHACWEAGGRRQSAPAQRLEDLVRDRPSSDLPDCSYLPGIVPRPLRELLPTEIMEPLKTALIHFGRTKRGYLTNDAVAVAVESRTSSPVRIPRDPETLEHPQVAGLYPCGEGAGYAGGIVSAALDGIRCAEHCGKAQIGN